MANVRPIRFLCCSSKSSSLPSSVGREPMTNSTGPGITTMVCPWLLTYQPGDGWWVAGGGGGGWGGGVVVPGGGGGGAIWFFPATRHAPRATFLLAHSSLACL